MNKNPSTTQAIIPVTPLHGFRVLGDPVSIGRRVLLVVCGFGPKPPKRGRWWRNILTLFILRSWFYWRMHAAAFPVSLQKQLGYAKAFLEGRDVQDVDITWYDHDSPPQEFTDFPCLRTILSEDTFRKLSGFNGYDTVIFSYPDPLGLGQWPLEKQTITWGITPLVINGRGRIILLTEKNRALLCRRRFLAQSRICEIILGIAIVPIAMTLALIDKLRGRT
jgi:hypothetical protein